MTDHATNSPVIVRLTDRIAELEATIERIQTIVDGHSSVSRRMNLIRDLLKGALGDKV